MISEIFGNREIPLFRPSFYEKGSAREKYKIASEMEVSNKLSLIEWVSVITNMNTTK